MHTNYYIYIIYVYCIYIYHICIVYIYIYIYIYRYGIYASVYRFYIDIHILHIIYTNIICTHCSATFRLWPLLWRCVISGLATTKLSLNVDDILHGKPLPKLGVPTLMLYIVV